MYMLGERYHEVCMCAVNQSTFATQPILPLVTEP